MTEFAITWQHINAPCESCGVIPMQHLRADALVCECGTRRFVSRFERIAGSLLARALKAEAALAAPATEPVQVSPTLSVVSRPIDEVAVRPTVEAGPMGFIEAMHQVPMGRIVAAPATERREVHIRECRANELGDRLWHCLDIIRGRDIAADERVRVTVEVLGEEAGG